MKEDISNTFIKPSKIHGLGLFAKRDIFEGEEILQGVADFDYREEWILYLKTIKKKSYAYNNGYCMVNHSETPNTKRNELDKIAASVTINQGDEITEDYNALPDNENPFKGLSLEYLMYG